MRSTFTAWLRCPRCRRNGALEAHSTRTDAREIREGTLVCRHCQAAYEVRDGIVDLLVSPPDAVKREIQGLERFADVMRTDGWDGDRIRGLPGGVEHGYWFVQSEAMRQLLNRISFRPGDRLVDVGSNTCWASNVFARLGLDVVALDISTVDLQGLGSAEHFLRSDEVYFERLLSLMSDPALADDSVDFAFCCQVLHHNRRPDLRKTFTEMQRILRPGGVLMVVNEPLRFPLRLKRDHGDEVAEFEGNENVYFLHEYYLAARRAGFRVEIPAFTTVRNSLNASITEIPAGAGFWRTRRSIRRWAPGRWLLMALRFVRFCWRYVIRGDANITLICTDARLPR